MNKRLCCGCLLLTMLLAACSEEVELPPAKPLNASAEQLMQVYKLQRGPYNVVAKTGAVLVTDEDKALDISLFYPEQPHPEQSSAGHTEEQFPLLLFSHGNWSTKDKYNAVIEHWVSHGYIVLAPNHLDCCSAINGIINSVRHGHFGLIAERMKDFAFLLDNLQQLDEVVDGLSALIDSQRIAATGHSFGAFSAQQFVGAGSVDPDTQAFVFFRDDRIKAVVAISPPGPMFDVINDQSWLQVDAPMLITTGTWDSNPQFWPDWRLHKMSFDTARPGANYALVIEGADHYLGNLICRPEREVAPQHDALNMLNATTVAFLDAYVKEDSVAQAFIDGDTLVTATGGFAMLERR